MAAEREKLEREVLELMAQGLSNKGICEKLVVSPKTVETHVNSIFWKHGLLVRGGRPRESGPSRTPE